MASRIETLLDEILHAVYGEEVRGSIHDAIEECYDDVSTAKTSAENATAEATAAATDATNKAALANTAATTANTAATRANEKATLADEKATLANTAAATATNAANSANAAKTAAQTAAANAEDAVTSANSAATSATSAASSATAAANLANAAAANATSAANSATTAATNANTKASQAETAATNATAATGNANSAAESATNAANSAIIAADGAATAKSNADAATAAAESATTNARNAANEASTAASSANSAATAATTAANDANLATTNAAAATADANTAAASCNSSAYSANVAANSANGAATRAVAAAQTIEGMTVSAETLPPSSPAYATVTERDGVKHISFGLVKGDQGAPFVIKGDAYETLEDLMAEVTTPAIGDMYNVGSTVPYNVYRWTGSVWEDQGTIGISFSAIENLDIDTLWGGDQLSGSDRKWLNDLGLYYLIQSKILAALSGKVDVVSGKGLSTNDFTNEYLTAIGGNTDRIAALETGKVDVVTGKGLSTNDYTAAEKNKLAGIAANATRVLVDSAISTSSTNPVQNAIITAELNNRFANSNGNIAAEYDPTRTYAIGDYRMYNGSLYRCTTAIQYEEAWTASHWTQISVMNERLGLYFVKNV